MAVTDIKALQILPPLAIGRFGSSAEPMHNYDATAGNDNGYRRLAPAETLVINPQSGEVVGAVMPPDVRFRDGSGRIKPVCPFLELWARFTDDGPFEPLTTSALQDLGLSPDSIRWSVSAANLKMFRRTGAPSDRITATIDATAMASHARQELRGRCVNFKTGMTISLGFVQYVRPNVEFPEIRVRYTPGVGQVFGHTAGGVIAANRAVYNALAGPWDTHVDGVQANSPTPRARLFTVPRGIYAQTAPVPPANTRVNLGYLDDSCDGIITATLEVGGRSLKAIARFSSGPPAFAPDSLPVRSVADDLEQWFLGEEVDRTTADEVISIVRRATETLRLTSTQNENASFPFWEEATAQEPFGPGGAPYASTRGLHESLLQRVQGLRAQPGTPERRAAVGALRAMFSVLRPPDKTADYSRQSTTGGRPPIQHMPALMRGSDGQLLALTRRQQRVLAVAIEQFGAELGGENTPRTAMLRLIGAHQFAATMHSGVALPEGETLSDRFASPESLLSYIADPASSLHGDLSQQLGFGGQPLVQPGDPDGSAFLQMISEPDHPMNAPLSGYTDSITSMNGIEVVRQWIASL